MMDALAEYFAMGGYAQFIWPAYLITAVILAALVILSLRDLRRQESMLSDLRRQRRDAVDEEVQL